MKLEQKEKNKKNKMEQNMTKKHQWSQEQQIEDLFKILGILHLNI